MGTSYKTDFAAWANEQAAMLRSGNLSDIDALNIAEEIGDVASRERQQLENRLIQLMAHLLKWHYQPDHRGHSWRSTIVEQRRRIPRLVAKTPSLKHDLADEEWFSEVWSSAVSLAVNETGLNFPEQQIWTLDQVLDREFWPG